MSHSLKFLIFLLFTVTQVAFAKTWQAELGVRGFKYSASGIPNEIGYNPVFARWEKISQQPDDYEIQSYSPLEPLYFNFNLGVDVLLRYRQYLMVKVGYDYSNPFGIGGTGRISYTEIETGRVVEEEKEYGYTSHQINYFIGPILPVGENIGDIYLGFSMMPPTWVSYREKFKRTVDGVVVRDYDMEFEGFFGSCRALVGSQIRVGERLCLGSEVVFSFLNYMKLKSGEIGDHSFQFPDMKWDFVLRYGL